MRNHFHIVFKTHLDVGFTDFAATIEKQYMEKHLPGAIRLAEQFRAQGGDERFVWTIGSWLALRALDTYRGAQLKSLEQAIGRGDIVWHALPFTTHTELMTPALCAFALSIKNELDARFGRKTRAARLTDVPGHTRGLIPLLAANGVDFLHIGCNPESTPPDVPELFKWRNPADGAEVAVMYQKGGYGKLFARKDLKTGLSVCFTSDNLGPPSVDEVNAAFAAVRKKYPGALIQASTLDAFAAGLFAEGTEMPVIEAEMGDTWIHGVGSAPGKVRRLRALSRLHEELSEAGVPWKYVRQFRRFSENLLLVCEHTGGLDVKTHLGDTKHFTPAQLRQARRKPNFAKMEASWKEQEDYTGAAVDSLRGTPSHRKAVSLLKDCEPARPDKAGFESVAVSQLRFSTRFFEIGFDAETGAVNRLLDKRANKEWAGPKNKFGVFMYEVFGAQDVARYLKQYGFVKKEVTDSLVRDFGKPGLEKVLETGARVQGRLRRAFVKEDPTEGLRVILELLPPPGMEKNYGCPRTLFASWTFFADRPAAELRFVWDEKPACRIPEALWLGFSPTGKGMWLLEKLGQWVDPLDVLRNGNNKLHAVDRGIFYQEKENSLFIETLDSPLVAPGGPSLYDFNNRRPDLRRGAHFNLFNNTWGTNFPQWSAESGLSRFTLDFAQR